MPFLVRYARLEAYGAIGIKTFPIRAMISRVFNMNPRRGCKDAQCATRQQGTERPIRDTAHILRRQGRQSLIRTDSFTCVSCLCVIDAIVTRTSGILCCCVQCRSTRMLNTPRFRRPHSDVMYFMMLWIARQGPTAVF